MLIFVSLKTCKVDMKLMLFLNDILEDDISKQWFFYASFYLDLC